MKRASVFPLVLLFCSTAPVAETAGQSQPQNTALRMSLPMNSCPVSLHARQARGGDMWKVNGGPISGPAQMLHLIVTNPDSRQVVAANVTVRGFTDKGRMIQVMSSQNSYDAVKTFDVKFPAGPGKETAAELRVPGFSAAALIDLNSVTYSDGSSWKLAAGSSCRSWVDGLMLVSSH